MILLPVCGWSLLRAVAICVIVIPLARALARAIDAEPGPFRSAVWSALALLVAMPDLAVGYAWADTGLEFGSYPWLNEVLYGALLAGKLLPIATVLCVAAPHDPLSLSARHLLKLAGIPRFDRFRITVGGMAPTVAPVAGVVFLLAFQDFELASRLGIRAWTITLFDLHAREGLPLADSVRLTMLPTIIELLMIVPVLALAVRGGTRRIPPITRPPRPLTDAIAGPVMLLLVIGVCLVPAWVVLRGALSGGAVLFRDAVYREQLPREIALGMTMAGLSAVGAFLAGRLIAERLLRQPAWLALVVPGLLGGLVLSLAGRYAAQAFDGWWLQLTGIRSVYNSPGPLILVQMLLLLPRAVLICLLLKFLTNGPADHLGVLLSTSREAVHCRTARELLWRGRRRGQFWSIVLLAWWGNWDLTTFSLLAPTGFVSAPVRLYNFMHFRQNTVLSAMLFAAIVVPAVGVMLAGILARRVSTIPR